MGKRQDGREHRSGCPINLSVEVLGDAWSLLIIRDLMFGTARHFGELLRSEEGIAPSVLAERLRRLVAAGLISTTDDPATVDPTHEPSCPSCRRSTPKQKSLYSLTEMGIALVPVVVQLGSWGMRFLPATDELSVRIEVLERGGPEMWDRFMAELRQRHLGAPIEPRPGPSVHERLETAYRARVAEGSPPTG